MFIVQAILHSISVDDLKSKTLLQFKSPLQDVRGQNIYFFNLALRERDIQVRLYLKVVLKFFDVELLIIQTNFQKSRLGWPQQPPTKCNFCS